MVVRCGKRSLKWTSGARKSSDTNPGHRTYRVPVQSLHVQGTIADHRERLRMVGSFRGINDGLKRKNKFHPGSGTHAMDVVRSPIFACHERLWTHGAKQFTNIRLVPVSNLELIASFFRAELAGFFFFVCNRNRPLTSGKRLVKFVCHFVLILRYHRIQFYGPILFVFHDCVLPP